MNLPPDFPHIKRVRAGTAYNTATSTFIHVRSTLNDPVQLSPYGPIPKPAWEQLFRTRSHEYFLVLRNAPVWDAKKNEFLLSDDIAPMSKEDAKAWLVTYFPESITTLSMGFSYTSSTNELAPLSIRIPKSLKDYLDFAAGYYEKTSITSYAIELLEHGVNVRVGAPSPILAWYTTDDQGQGRQLLTNDGRPGYDGIAENADNAFEVERSECAANFRQCGHTIPDVLRKYLIKIISTPHLAEREVLLKDVKRWLELYEPDPATKGRAAKGKHPPGGYDISTSTNSTGIFNGRFQK